MYHLITAYRKKKEKKIDNIVKPRHNPIWQYIKMTLNVQIINDNLLNKIKKKQLTLYDTLHKI